MDNKVIKKDNKGFKICNFLYKKLVYIGNKFYILSEKCVIYSRDRAKKIALDEEYEKRMSVGTLVLDKQKTCNDTLHYEEMDISCVDTVKELSITYIELKQELESCRGIVYALWEAHYTNNKKKTEEIFNSLGLKSKKENEK